MASLSSSKEGKKEMSISISVLFIILGYVLGYFWGKEIRGYFKHYGYKARKEKAILLTRLNEIKIIYDKVA